MSCGDFVTRFRAGEAVIGTWLTIPEPTIIEAMGPGNFDFLLVDGEHGPAHPDILHPLVAASERIKQAVVYRARRNRSDLVGAALDAGACGIMVPMVDTPAEAEAAVAAAKYPPLGKRGFGPWRSSDYYRDMGDYTNRANQETLVAVQIEHNTPVKNVDEIAATPGVDLLYVGPADLALSLGLQVGETHPLIEQAFVLVAEAARKHGKVAGTDITNMDQAHYLQKIGYRCLTYGGDLTYLSMGAAEWAARLRATMLSKGRA